MAKKKWDFDPIVTGSSQSDQITSAEVRHLLRTRPYWQQLADSLTEPARKQLLDDLRGWNEATWEHRQHPPKPGHPSEGRIGNGA